MNRRDYCLIMIVVGLLFVACKKDSNEPNGKYLNGIFITNEGTYLSENGSISYYDTENDSVVNEIFYLQNNKYPGDLVHSLSTFNNRAYICVRGSGKIEITDLSFNRKDSIGNLDGVRYFIGATEDKGYATSWDKGSIWVINLKNKSVSGNIIVSHSGHDRMLIDNNRLFIANNGGQGVDSTISVIDISTDQVIGTINLDAYKPSGLVKDNSGYLYVLCQGKEAKHGGPTPAKLIKISLESLDIVNSVQLFENQFPMHLSISPDYQWLYYGAGLYTMGIYKMDVSTMEVPAEPIVSDLYYAMGISPADGKILAVTKPNFTGKGDLRVYDSDGNLLKNLKIGIAPENVNY